MTVLRVFFYFYLVVFNGDNFYNVDESGDIDLPWSSFKITCSDLIWSMALSWKWIFSCTCTSVAIPCNLLYSFILSTALVLKLWKLRHILTKLVFAQHNNMFYSECIIQLSQFYQIQSIDNRNIIIFLTLLSTSIKVEERELAQWLATVVSYAHRQDTHMPLWPTGHRLMP